MQTPNQNNKTFRLAAYIVRTPPTLSRFIPAKYTLYWETQYPGNGNFKMKALKPISAGLYVKSVKGLHCIYLGKG